MEDGDLRLPQLGFFAGIYSFHASIDAATACVALIDALYRWLDLAWLEASVAGGFWSVEFFGGLRFGLIWLRSIALDSM